MKRFIVDGLLVIILVAIGSSFMNQTEKPFIYEKIDEFEEKISKNEHYESIENQPVKFNHINKASQLAKSSGEVIEDVVGVSVELVASIFKALVE